MFSTHPKKETSVVKLHLLSSAITLSLDQTKTLSIGKELNLYQMIKTSERDFKKNVPALFNSLSNDKI